MVRSMIESKGIKGLAKAIWYGQSNPVEFGMIKGWDYDPSKWTTHQIQEYMKWDASKTPATDVPEVETEWDGRVDVDEVLDEFGSSLGGERSFAERALSDDPWWERQTFESEKGAGSVIPEEKMDVPVEGYEDMEAGEAGGTTEGPVSFEDLPKIPELPDALVKQLAADMTPEEHAIMNDALEANLVGESPSGGAFLDWGGFASSIGKNVAMGLVMQPLINWMDSHGLKSEADFIQIGGAAWTAMALNPLGLSFGGVGILGYLMQEYGIQRQRISENDFATDYSDTKFGFVMEQGKWMPAVLRKRIKGEGVSDTSNQLEFVYGKPEEFYLQKDQAGKVRGHFLHERTKEFRESDTGWDTRQSGEEREKRDYLRQWYTLSPDETQKMMSQWSAGDFDQSVFAKTLPVDTSTYTPYMKKNLDFASGLDLIQTTRERGKQVNTDSASKKFRADAMEYLFESGREGEYKGKFVNEGAGGEVPEMDWIPGQEDMLHGDWDDDWKAWKQGLKEWREIEKPGGYFSRQLEDLYGARDIAADEAGVPREFYVDGDMPPASDYATLKQQYDTIDGMNKTQAQKDYLQMKSATRWMMQNLSDMGYTRIVADQMHNDEDPVSGSQGGYKTGYGYLPASKHGSPYRTDEGMNLELGERLTSDDGDNKNRVGAESDQLPFLSNYSMYAGVPAWVNEGEDALHCN